MAGLSPLTAHLVGNNAMRWTPLQQPCWVLRSLVNFSVPLINMTHDSGGGNKIVLIGLVLLCLNITTVGLVGVELI